MLELIHLSVDDDQSNLTFTNHNLPQNCLESYQNIAINIKNHPQIQSLTIDLKDLDLGIEFFTNFGIGIANCTQLICLNLKLMNCQINDNCLNYLEKILPDCKFLIKIVLQFMFNQITCEGVSNLGKGIAKCKNIANLQLSFDYNQISDKGITQLSKSLVEIKNLVHLSLSLEKNKIQEEGAYQLGKHLALFTKLKNLSLNLSQNQIKAKGVHEIGFGIQKCINIQNLILIFNHVNLIYDNKKYGMQPLGSQISKCNNLKKLVIDLSQNSSASHGELEPILEQCKNLRHLEFTFKTKISSYESFFLNNLALVLGKATNITFLSLFIENQRFGVQGGKLMASELLKCINLQSLELNLKFTNISDIDVEKLVFGMKGLLKISQFYLVIQQSWASVLELKRKQYLKLFKKMKRIVQYKINFYSISE